MTTIVLDDNLINEVIEIGNYQNPQEAVAAILADYVKTYQSKKILTHKSSFEDTPAFNMWQDRDDMNNVEDYVENIRKPREQNVY
jgi:hypothetical protein